MAINYADQWFLNIFISRRKIRRYNIFTLKKKKTSLSDNRRKLNFPWIQGRSIPSKPGFLFCQQLTEESSAILTSATRRSQWSKYCVWSRYLEFFSFQSGPITFYLISIRVIRFSCYIYIYIYIICPALHDRSATGVSPKWITSNIV